MSSLFDFVPRREPVALNPQQRAVVEHSEGPLLVVAGAGTGKTRVITERIRWLLESQPGLSGEAILGLTFTDKAAAEMKQRVSRAVGERGKHVQLGTFHWFCYALLSEVHPALRVLEEPDHWILLRRNMRLLGLDRYRRLAEPGQFLGDFVQFFSRCQDELVTPDDYQRYAERLRSDYERSKHELELDARRQQEDEVARQEEIARVYRTSDTLLRERNLLTFGAQLLEAVQLLRSNHQLRERLRARYRYILVDEFQDTNIAQIELLWLLAEAHRSIVAVGDDEQAIYRFRGASFGSFTIFLERFAGVKATSRDAAECIRPLTLNYRSTGRILRVAGQVIAQNEKSPLLPKKDLTPQKPPGERIRIAEFPSPEEEAQWIAAELDRLHREERLNWRDFAVLFRMHTHRDRLVEALNSLGIPFVIRNLSILGNRLVRDLISYLRLIAVPADNVACARVLSAPFWGLEPADLVRLCERANKGRGMALWDALESAQGELPFTNGSKKAVELVSFVRDFRNDARRLPVTQLYAGLVSSLHVGAVASEDDRRYIERLGCFIQEWEAKSESERLPEFVEYLEFFQQAGGQICLEEQDRANAVQLMTVHAAKGLEFEHVFVMRLVEGSFPSRLRPRVLEFPEELMKEEKPRGDFHIQEERRLFYVALTRARERLTLTTVVHNRSKHSTFLEDILMEPTIQHSDVRQLAPKAAPQSRMREPLQTTERPAQAELAFPDTSVDSGLARLPSRIARWATSYRPPVFEPLQLSASAIESYRSCPQKYLFERVWGIRDGPQAATSFGSVMHNAVRQFVAELSKKRPMPFEEVEAIFAREWTAAGFEDSYQEEEYKKDGLEQLRAFHATCCEAPPSVIAQEKRFELPLENNVVITGRIDQINRIRDRDVEIVDYKTGKPKHEAYAKKHVQLSLYALAARDVFELNPVRLIYYNLENNQIVATARDAKQLNEATAIVQEVARDIRASQFDPRPGYRCHSCEFRELCPAHEQIPTGEKQLKSA